MNILGLVKYFVFDAFKVRKIVQVLYNLSCFYGKIKKYWVIEIWPLVPTLVI